MTEQERFELQRMTPALRAFDQLRSSQGSRLQPEDSLRAQQLMRRLLERGYSGETLAAAVEGAAHSPVASTPLVPVRAEDIWGLEGVFLGHVLRATEACLQAADLDAPTYPHPPSQS